MGARPRGGRRRPAWRAGAAGERGGAGQRLPAAARGRRGAADLAAAGSAALPRPRPPCARPDPPSRRPSPLPATPSGLRRSSSGLSLSLPAAAPPVLLLAFSWSPPQAAKPASRLPPAALRRGPAGGHAQAPAPDWPAAPPAPGSCSPASVISAAAAHLGELLPTVLLRSRSASIFDFEYLVIQSYCSL